MVSESLKTNIQLSKFPALISCGRDEVEQSEQSEQSEDRIGFFLQIISVTGEIRYLAYLSEYLINTTKKVSALRQFLSRGLISTETIYITPNTSFLLVFVAGYHGMVAEELRGKDSAVSILTSCMDSIL